MRYRDFMQPQGYDDELRAVFRTGNSTWGVVGLYREGVHPPFDEDDVAVMKGISSAVARALRSRVRQISPWLEQPSAPGLVVIDRDGRVVSANTEALGWLRELWPMSPSSNGPELASLDAGGLREIGLEVPTGTLLTSWEGGVRVTALIALVARARAVAEGRERAPARLRLRDRRGRWLVLHASSLTGPADSEGGSVAIVIEAAKSAEIAPIIIEAYSLTPRERDVLGAIARGGSTAEIAAELFLSPHTVRDYVKSVFEKFGVSSRSELVARLYGEHYSHPLHETMVHVG
jgi:DNA-binding CsgD family transcriptional regulator